MGYNDARKIICCGSLFMKKYPAEKSFYVFLSFAAVGGFLEAYTYLLHGGVFCNAQTGNIVLLTLHLFSGSFAEAAHYLYSISAYLAGIFISAVLARLLKNSRPQLIVTAAELAAFAALAFIPAGASDWYTYVSVAFLCALQYNVFTECRGAALSTTFCTNNLRQAALNLYRGAAEKDREKLRKSGIYALVILFFALGAAAGAFTAERLGNYSILICSAILIPVWVLLAVSGAGYRPSGPHTAPDKEQRDEPGHGDTRRTADECTAPTYAAHSIPSSAAPDTGNSSCPAENT